MDRARKFLRKLSSTKQDEISEILSKIDAGKTHGLDIKKLKGHKNIFRVRAGDIRIVFSEDRGTTAILFIGMRGDSKYEQF